MYIIARTASKRPSLQHRLVLGDDTDKHVTACGIDVSMWSRAYQNKPIPQVLCIRCRKSDK